MKKVKFMALLLFFTTPGIALCQGDSSVVDHTLSKLKTLFNNRTQEKVYLHFDKPFYALGDTMYFKAYLLMGERHETSAISGVLYVDLIRENNKPVRSIKLQVVKGTTVGDFALPDSLASGNYHVRAYTNWMRNTPGGIFDKIIPIRSPNEKRIIYESGYKVKTNDKRAPNCQFFPEGGNLVVDVRSKVAFKAVGSNGLGVDVSGVIIDNERHEVAAIKSSHLGMGSFSFLPEEGRSYRANLMFANGVKSMVDLPAIAEKGITLSVSNHDPGKISIEIKANRAYYKENLNKELAIVIYGSGVARTVKTRLDNEVLGLNLPAGEFKTGIVQVTLFTQTGEPLSERLTFIRNNDLLNLQVVSNHDAYHKREQIHLSLNASEKGNAANGSFSVSVVNEDLIPAAENKETTILSQILLASDLKGLIEEPNYYFADTTAAARHNLDVLLLTQGFRRFSWKEVLADQYPALAYQPEKNLEISGKVNFLSGGSVIGGTVNLVQVPAGQLLTRKTDEQGIFHFSNLVFTDTMSFVLNAVNAEGKNATKVTRFSDQPKFVATNYAANIYSQISDTSMNRFLENEKIQLQTLSGNFHPKGILLKEVKIKQVKQDDKYYTQSLAGPGHADQVMHAEDFQHGGGRLSDQLNGRLRGIQFFYGVPYLSLSLMSVTGQPPKPMMVIVDGVELSASLQADQSVSSQGYTVSGYNIDALNLMDVESVEVLRNASTSIYGMTGAGGVLIITTKQGGGKGFKDISAIGILPITVTGFYKAREFYTPKYDVPAVAMNGPDLRSTIYWQPEIKTDKYGNASISYFNADGTGTYRVIVEGMDEQGNIGRQVYRYKVQ